MYSSLSIQNFRCFKQVELQGLGQVTLVTGMNNAGKTSFLEALFLLIGGFNPSLPLRLNVLRGMDAIVTNSEEQWGWLFHNHDVSRTIQIAADDLSGGQDALRLHLGNQREFELITKGEQELPVSLSGSHAGSTKPMGIPSTGAGLAVGDLILEFKEHRGRNVVSRVSVSADGTVKFQRPRENGFRPGAFLATRVRASSEDADRLSQLKRVKRDSEVVTALKALEPNLRDLTILVLGNDSVIHADLAGTGLVPIPLLGEGFGRLLSLSLAILTTSGGLVLVDEIENGIHHSALPKVWEGLAAATRQAEVQLVATTHSEECLRAAHSVFSNQPQYAFAVVQLFRLATGIEGRTLDRRHIQAAIDGHIDLR